MGLGAFHALRPEDLQHPCSVWSVLLQILESLTCQTEDNEMSAVIGILWFSTDVLFGA